MNDQVKVTGLDELQRMLDTLPAKLERNVMRSGLRAGAKVIADEAKSLAPVGSPSKTGRDNGGYPGALRDSIRITTSTRGGQVKASVKAGGKNRKTGADVFYANMVEYGTASHFILGPLKIGKTVLAGVKHPGAKAQPFMRPALDQTASRAVVAVGEKVKQRLSKKHGLDTSGINLDLED